MKVYDGEQLQRQEPKIPAKIGLTKLGGSGDLNTWLKVQLKKNDWLLHKKIVPRVILQTKKQN